MFKPGDLVTYKRDPGSLYMVIERQRFKIFVVGVTSKGEVVTNDYEFANFGSMEHDPDPNIFRFNKLKKWAKGYISGSLFDYLYKVIVYKTLEIIDYNNEDKYMNTMFEEGLKKLDLDPREDKYEYIYKEYFKKKGENNNGV